MTEAGVAEAIEDDVPDEAVESAAEAMESCPVNVIEVNE